VGSLVSIGLFSHDMERSVTREARSLMGGDVEVRLSHPLTPSAETILRELQTRGIISTHISELVSMAATFSPGPESETEGRGRTTHIVELKAVQAGYPLYGKLKVTPSSGVADLLSPQPPAQPGEGTPSVGSAPHAPLFGAIVQPALLLKMGTAVGNRIKIGEATFVIRGIIEKEPDRVASLFSLGPRIMISQEGLEAAALIKPGSRVRERYLLRLPPELATDTVVSELRARMASESARVLSYREAQPQLRRFLEQVAGYACWPQLGHVSPLIS
jgi:putative ABC transport system permease protein